MKAFGRKTKPVLPKRRKGDNAPHSRNPLVGALSPLDVMVLLNITHAKYRALISPQGDQPAALETILVRGVRRVPVVVLRRAFPSLFSP